MSPDGDLRKRLARMVEAARLRATAERIAENAIPLGSVADRIAGLMAEVDTSPHAPFPSRRHRGRRAVALAKTLAAAAIRPYTRFLFQRQAELGNRLLPLIARVARSAQALAASTEALANPPGAPNEALTEELQQLKRSLEGAGRELPRIEVALERLESSARRFRERGAPVAGDVEFGDSFFGGTAARRARDEALVRAILPVEGPVLDVGCGRGERIALLRAAGARARGIDADAGAAALARAAGHEVACGDVLPLMAGAPEGELGGILACGALEQLGRREIPRFLELCLRALRPGGRLVVENANPRSLGAVQGFLASPRHQKMLGAEVLAYLVERRGFDEVRVEGVAAPALVGEDPWRADGALGPALARIQAELFGPNRYRLSALKPRSK